MGKWMTIRQFAERTGVSKSALRYYESVELLCPKARNNSGYRVYAEDQVEIARLIASLRLADVPIKEIRAYVKETDAGTRASMMERWIRAIRQRQERLQVSLRYLESDSVANRIYLIDKPEESIVWFPAESEMGKFDTHFDRRRRELENRGIAASHCYLHYLSGREWIKARIGFSLPSAYEKVAWTGTATVERMPACLCLALPFHEPVTEIDRGYHTLLRFATEHGWVPAGSILERYRWNNLADLELLMPVTKLERRGSD